MKGVVKQHNLPRTHHFRVPSSVTFVVNLTSELITHMKENPDFLEISAFLSLANKAALSLRPSDTPVQSSNSCRQILTSFSCAEPQRLRAQLHLSTLTHLVVPSPGSKNRFSLARTSLLLDVSFFQASLSTVSAYFITLFSHENALGISR